MESTVSQILSFMPLVEKYGSRAQENLKIENRPVCNSGRILKLCYLCFLFQPYLKSKTDLKHLLQLSLIKLFDDCPENVFSRLPEEFTVLKAENKALKTYDSRLVAFLDEWPMAAKDRDNAAELRSLLEKNTLLKKLKEPFFTPSPFLDTLFGFMTNVTKLGFVNRDNLLFDGRHESDADHIIKLCWWIMLSAPFLQKKADYLRMLEIALVHDVVEARSGDISLSLQRDNVGIKFEKIRSEWEAVSYFRATLPAPVNNTLYNLFEEYETRETTEAKYVWVLDKLDAAWQANQHKGGDIRYWADCPGGRLYYPMSVTPNPKIKDLNEPLFSALEKDLIKISADNIKKWNIKY